MDNYIIIILVLASIFIITITVLFSIIYVKFNNNPKITPLNDPKHQEIVNALKDEPKDIVTFENYTNPTPKVIILTYYDKDKLNEYGKKWKSINPTYTIELYDDKDCYEYLLNKFSEYHANIFENIIDGPIKSDYFRIHRMIEGGVYTDIDQPAFDVDPWINQFVIPLRTFKTFYRGVITDYYYEPSFIISQPNHSFIKQCIRCYDKIVKNVQYSYNNWSIVKLISILDFQNNEKIPYVIYYVIPRFRGIIKKFYKAYLLDVKYQKKIADVKLPEYNYKLHSF